MTDEERNLLLTVARTMRANEADHAEELSKLTGVRVVTDDLAALNEALAPFDPSDAEPVNEESR